LSLFHGVGKGGGAGHVAVTGTVGGTGYPPPTTTTTTTATTSASLHFVAFNCERVDCIQLVSVGILGAEKAERGLGNAGKLV